MTISITSRVRNAMVGLTLALCALFTVLIFLLIYVIEDQVFVNQMRVEQAAFEQIIDNGDPQQIQNWQPSNANIKRINTLENLPKSLPNSRAKQISNQRGIHEYFDDNNAMFIASLARPNSGRPYYLVYDVQNLLVVQNTKHVLFTLIVALTLLITGLSILLANRLTKATLAPVSRLSTALKNDDLDHVIIELANEFSGDEIAVLTQELAKSLEQVRESAQREYEFNRGVSHELRSPIQVAQSATELLQLVAQKGDTRIKKPVDRLQRSITEMSEVAEAFLWLASERVIEQGDTCSIEQLQNTLTELQSSFSNHNIEPNFQTTERTQYPLPSKVLSVILRNLVRNAVTHGDIAEITVDLNDDGISVSNSISTQNSNGKTFGVGMSIVERICDRFDCTLATKIEGRSRYICSIIFA